LGWRQRISTLFYDLELSLVTLPNLATFNITTTSNTTYAQVNVLDPTTILKSCPTYKDPSTIANCSKYLAIKDMIMEDKNSAHYIKWRYIVTRHVPFRKPLGVHNRVYFSPYRSSSSDTHLFFKQNIITSPSATVPLDSHRTKYASTYMSLLD